jgi:type I toxin-antitoxin system toxin SymE
LDFLIAACPRNVPVSPALPMMNTRTLKIESAGDFWRGKVSPKIRLSGHWLERAGFKPGNRVVVQASEPGILTLRFLEQTTPDSE